MKTISIYEEGDVIEFVTDWRLWKTGDIATVVGTSFENGMASNQFVTLQAHSNKEAENDISTVYAYNVKLKK